MKSKFSEERIATALRQVGPEAPGKEPLCRKPVICFPDDLLKCKCSYADGTTSLMREVKRSKRTILWTIGYLCELVCIIMPSLGLSYDLSSDPQATYKIMAGTSPVVQSSFTSTSGKEIIVGPEEVILPNHRKPYSWPDGNMGIIKSGELFSFFGAADGAPKRALGTLDNPQAQGVMDLRIEQLKNKYDYAAGGPIYQEPSTGTLLMFYHAERQIVPPGYIPFYSELGIARSTDGGSTWIDLGPIITIHTPFSSEYFQGSRESFDIGGGDYLVIGGYFYVYFRDLIQDGGRHTLVNLAIARARVSDVVDAAVKKSTVIPWTKYFNGAWTEPGMGGRSSPLETDNHDLFWGDVSYNSHLGKYITITPGSPWPATSLYWLESEDGLHWSNYQKIVHESVHNMYVTIVGFGDDTRETGKQFYIYYIRSQLFAQNGVDRNGDAVLVRRLISLP